MLFTPDDRPPDHRADRIAFALCKCPECDKPFDTLRRMHAFYIWGEWPVMAPCPACRLRAHREARRLIQQAR